MTVTLPLGLIELSAIAPILVLALTAVTVLLLVAFRRDHAWTFQSSVAGLFVALFSLWPAAHAGSRAVTELLYVDAYGLYFIGLFCVSGIIVALFARDYLRSSDAPPEEFYLLLLTALLGASVLAVSAHFASFFLGLETLSISLFPLLAYSVRDVAGMEAATKYLILSGVASAFLLFGMALLYAESGALEFDGMIAPVTPAGRLGIALLLVGIGFKLSFFPFHLWTADVYQGAPAPVTALLATVSKSSVFAVLLRYGTDAALAGLPFSTLLISVLAGGSMIIGNLLALRQRNLKRLLAYSSIAHMGYLLLVVVALSKAGSSFASESLGFYLTAYTVTTLAAFGVIGVLGYPGRELDELEDVTGLFWTRPAAATLLTVSILSLAGIPLTAGFVGKFYLFTAAAAAEAWILLTLFVIGSGIGLYYYLRVVFAMAASPERGCQSGAAMTRSYPVRTETALAFLGLAILILGLLPSSVVGFLSDAAMSR